MQKGILLTFCRGLDSEIPCQLHFEGNSKDIDNAKNLVQYAMKACNADAAIDKVGMIVKSGPLTWANLDVEVPS